MSFLTKPPASGSMPRPRGQRSKPTPEAGFSCASSLETSAGFHPTEVDGETDVIGETIIQSRQGFSSCPSTHSHVWNIRKPLICRSLDHRHVPSPTAGRRAALFACMEHVQVFGSCSFRDCGAARRHDRLDRFGSRFGGGLFGWALRQRLDGEVGRHLRVAAIAAIYFARLSGVTPGQPEGVEGLRMAGFRF